MSESAGAERQDLAKLGANLALTDLAAWLTQIWDEQEDQFEKACEVEAEALCHDGMPGTTAEDIREFWLKPETESGWPLQLARIAADRQILALHTGNHECPYWDSHGEWWEDLYCPTQFLLASAYADRPGFQDAWKP